MRRRLNMDYQKKEMELFDYLKILANSWRILGLSILGLTLIGICFAVALPKYYAITSIIGFAGAPIKPNEIAEKIKEGVYDERVLKTLGREKFPAGLEVKAVLLTNSPVMKILVKTPSVELAFGTACLQELLKIINEENKTLIKLYEYILANKNKKEKIGVRLAVFEKKLKRKQEYLNYLKEKLELLNKQEIKLEKELSIAKSMRNKAEKVNRTSLLDSKLYTLREKRDRLDLGMKYTYKALDEITAEVKLETIELSYLGKNNINIIDEIVKDSDIKIMRGPEPKPVKSKALLMVLIFAVIGLVIGVFLALMIEYLRQEKEKRNNNI